MDRYDKALDKLKFDKRLISWNLKNGTITEADLKSELSQLEDLSDQCVPIDIGEEEAKPAIAAAAATTSSSPSPMADSVPTPSAGGVISTELDSASDQQQAGYSTFDSDYNQQANAPSETSDNSAYANDHAAPAANDHEAPATDDDGSSDGNQTP